jgi:hypothetical protein
MAGARRDTPIIPSSPQAAHEPSEGRACAATIPRRQQRLIRSDDHRHAYSETTYRLRAHRGRGALVIVGVGSVAIALLSKLGYRVISSTGRQNEFEYLGAFGAAEILDRNTLPEPSKSAILPPLLDFPALPPACSRPHPRGPIRLSRAPRAHRSQAWSNRG